MRRENSGKNEGTVHAGMCGCMVATFSVRLENPGSRLIPLLGNDDECEYVRCCGNLLPYPLDTILLDAKPRIEIETDLYSRT